MMRRTTFTAAGLSLLLVLTGCSGQDNETEPSAPTSEPASADDHPESAEPVFPDLDEYTPPPPGLKDDHSGEEITPEPVPSWDEETRSEVIAAAKHALEIFAQPGQDYDTWWSELEPLMTAADAENYAYVDPDNIPVSKITGEGELIDDDSAYFAIVEFPTDAGRYHMMMSRTDGQATWLVSRIAPIEDP